MEITEREYVEFLCDYLASLYKVLPNDLKLGSVLSETLKSNALAKAINK